MSVDRRSVYSSGVTPAAVTRTCPASGSDKPSLLPRRPLSLPGIKVNAVEHRIDLQIARIELAVCPADTIKIGSRGTRRRCSLALC
jgi:hypothetical protein